MNYRFPLLLAAFGLLCLPFLRNAWADDNMPNNQAQGDHQRAKLTKNDMIFQSSHLSDLNVYHKDNMDTKLGNLDNLIINEHTGNVLFGILDTGVGGKKIAVPWNAFQLAKGTGNDLNKYFLTLNKTPDELKTAPTFDRDQIAQITNRDWQQSVQKFFGVQMVAKPEDLRGSGQLTVHQLIFESSKLSDLNVYNRNDIDQKLGNLDDLIVNAHSGSVEYAVLDTGVGGKTVAVPWEALLLQKETNKDNYWLTLNKTQEDLKNAPAFDTNQISQVTDPNWQQSVDNFFGVRMAAKPKQ